jgi:hypothetical protein
MNVDMEEERRSADIEVNLEAEGLARENRQYPVTPSPKGSIWRYRRAY